MQDLGHDIDIDNDIFLAVQDCVQTGITVTSNKFEHWSIWFKIL
jgi:hypothetical protein